MHTNTKTASGNNIRLGTLPKLLIGILVPLCLVLILMSTFLGIQGSGVIKRVMQQEVTASASSAANEVDAFFQRYLGIVDTLASTQLVRDAIGRDTGSMTEDQLYGSLMETLKLLEENNSEDIAFLWIADFHTGEILQSDGTLYTSAEVDYTTRTWYDMVMEKQDAVLTGAYESINTNSQMVTMASPVFINGEIRGIVGADLDLNRINQMMQGVKVGQTGYITLYDVNNEIIYHPDPNVIYTNAADANYSSNMLDAIMNHQSMDAVLYSRNGTDYYGSTVLLDDFDYMVLGVMPVAEYTQQITAIMRILIVGVVVCGLLLAGICIKMALSITKPLKQLAGVVDKLANGELDVEVNTRGATRWPPWDMMWRVLWIALRNTLHILMKSPRC